MSTVGVARALLLLLGLSLTRQSESQPDRPGVVLIVTQEIALSDLMDPNLPHLHALARSAQVGLMNTAVSVPRSPLAAMMAIALGSHAPVEQTDDQIYRADEPVERTSARKVFQRRIGGVPPASPQIDFAGSKRLFHLGWASLLRRGLGDRLLGEVLHRAGSSPFAVIADRNELGGRSSALLGLDSTGTAPTSIFVPSASEDNRAEGLLSAAASNGDAAIHVSRSPGEDRTRTVERLDRLIGELVARGITRSSRLLLVSTFPPPAADGAWDRLAVVLAAGPGLRPGLLTSMTTRTPGLVANIDIAPTLLSWKGVAVPVTMTGHPVVAQKGEIDALTRMDRLAVANMRGETPLFATIGALGALACAAGLWRRFHGMPSPWSARLVLCVMTFPFVMLFPAPFGFDTVSEIFGAVIVGMVLAGAACETWAGRRDRQNSYGPLICLSISAVSLLIFDTFTGQKLIKFSLFSAYQLQGIRFYGIGNEFMGVLVGLTLLYAFQSRLSFTRAAVLFAVVVLTLGWPALGANAGGAIASTAAFTCGLAALSGRRAGPAWFLFGCTLGISAAICIAMIDRAIGSDAATHMGGTLAAAGERGWSYLLEIVTRKAEMNLRIMTHPVVLTAMAGLLLIFAAASRGARRAVLELAHGHPEWKSGLAPAAWGALAALLFNDSGIVAALFLFGAFFAAGVYLLFRQPSGDLGAAAAES